jgi:hypothetical protein
MSKRRKNAGEGYGYMFHGSFSKKADAVAKERKTKGAWVKSTPTNQGYRHIVMSPRTNPIKRKKKKPAAAPNPSELLVMGANPSTHEIHAKQGDTITIRVNPSCATAHEVHGVNPGAQICGAKIGGEVCTRKPGHRGPHLPQGATMRTRERLPRNWKPRANPSAAALREAFTGKDANSYTVHREDHMPAGDYAQLGKLLALYVKPHGGGQVQVIKPRGTILVADESARRLWFVGGDQDISAALGVFGARQRGDGLVELGEARRLDYKQRKEHVPDPDVDEWRHEFGEESGVSPLVLFDAAHKRLLLEGGEYVVRAEGIVN